MQKLNKKTENSQAKKLKKKEITKHKTIKTKSELEYTSTQLHCVSKKNDNDLLRYNFNAHQPTLIIFGRDITE